MNKPFKFKRFTVEQDKCAMKIGTDRVLLGACTSVENNLGTVLDINSGTGVVALMIAQKSLAETIGAIEIKSIHLTAPNGLIDLYFVEKFIIT